MIGFPLIIGLADKLGASQAVKARLLQQPDEAVDKPVLVFNERSGILTTIDTELASYLSLHFDPEVCVRDESPGRRSIWLT